jgi:hypothetical protein
VQRPHFLPDADRLSVLAAMILLAYALARFIDLPGTSLGVQLPGFYISLQLNVQTIVAFLVALLTATGADWLLREHPALGKGATIEHWLLPALTAWVIGIPLFQVPLGPLWWAGFAVGGAFLMLVLVAEYIVVDSEDIRQPVAAAGLTVLSFALYLILAITLRIAGLRAFLIVPGLGFAIGLVSLRTLHLRLHGRWAFVPAGVIALLTAQIAAALHYLPITPVTYGLLLLGPAYALTSLLANLAEDEPLRQAVVEPALVLVIVLGAAWLTR